MADRGASTLTDPAALSGILARLEAAEARLAILDLEAEYARSWDAGDAEAWAGLFTPDGVFDMAGVGQQGRQVFTGHSELAGFCRNVDGFYKGLHFMHLPRLRIEGDIACGRVHFQWIGLYNQGLRYHGQRHVAGYYDVTYRRMAGQWRIQHRLEKAILGQINDSYDLYLSPDLPSPRA